MTNTNIFVNIHVLQDVPPANLNRDDSGSPKSARYGGVDRLRVSSQAWKRAARLKFGEFLPLSELGVRTRRVQDTVVDALTEAGIAEELTRPTATKLLEQIKISSGKKEDQSAYLLFFSRSQLTELADRVKEVVESGITDPSEIASQIQVKDILGHGHSLDVALFGRMVADLPEINVDAACQVAHALGTHSSPTQFDYFTAVDDQQTDAETGAGMIGTVEFNSATLYRFATVNLPALAANMDSEELAIQGIGYFIRSFVSSMPAGKQNTFAAHTRPGLVMVEIRTDQPVSYISAFEEPVKAGDRGYLKASIDRLSEFVSSERGRWGDDPLAVVSTVIAGVEPAGVFGELASFDDLVGSVESTLKGVLANG